MTTIDPPARIAVLGAGPVGIEAAIYARYLGYEVTILEKDDVAAGLRDVRSQPLWGPFANYATPLGISALQAQNEDFAPPDDAAQMTIGEWLDAYLLPLAQSDLISDSLQLNSAAVAMERLETAEDEHEEDAHHLQVMIRAGDSLSASTVIDATGPANPYLDLNELGIALCDRYHSVNGIAQRFRDSPALKTICLDTADLVLGIPYFYCLGARSFGTSPDFELRYAHCQIRDLFKLIGDRESLDLYAALQTPSAVDDTPR